MRQLAMLALVMVLGSACMPGAINGPPLRVVSGGGSLSPPVGLGKCVVEGDVSRYPSECDQNVQASGAASLKALWEVVKP